MLGCRAYKVSLAIRQGWAVLLICLSLCIYDFSLFPEYIFQFDLYLLSFFNDSFYALRDVCLFSRI